MEDRQRADALLVARGLAPSRTRARAWIQDGRVAANGNTVERPAQLLERNARLEVSADDDFVSRAGRKLDAALEVLSVDAAAKTCADVGASTGGFTECLLRRGATRVYAIDVGRDQLAPALHDDPRVVSLERTDIRDLDASDVDGVELAVVDVSFISVVKVAPAVAKILRPGSIAVFLIKPQFEVGPRIARRARGVIVDDAIRTRAIDAARKGLVDTGFEILGETDSAVAGAQGNREHFVLARR